MSGRFVMKFGGSALRSRPDLEKVLEIAKAYVKPFVMVVSAVNGVTDELVRAARGIGGLDVNAFLAGLYGTCRDMLGADCRGLEARVFEIRDLLLGAKLIGETPDSVYDRVVSHGERCSSFLVTKYFNERGFCCEEALPEDFGLITHGKPSCEGVDLEASEREMKAYFRPGASYVVPGFYGMCEGRVTLLGRGGSDYTASSIACCLDAERVDLYKDVSGFMTCDPKYVDGVKRMRTLSYGEAAELSYFGARILNHSAVEPVRRKNIPLYIYNMNTFSSIDNPDTVISGDTTPVETVIKSFTFTDDIGIIEFKGSNVGRVPGVLGQIASAFGNEGVNIKSVETSQTSINVLVSLEDVARGKRIARNLKVAEVERVECRSGRSLIAAVGSGILRKHGIAAGIFSAVSREKVNVEMISAGASEAAVYFIVDTRDRNKALRAVHEEFFGGEQVEEC